MDSALMHTITVWAGIGLLFFAITMLAITDVLRKDFGSTRAKALWGLVAVFPFIGWVFYLLFGFRKGKVPADESKVNE
ncbi:MAG: PLDc N-terminal domain-containing protein [Desulfobacteraceae bacterium]|jgi:hypothetical protein